MKKSKLKQKNKELKNELKSQRLEYQTLLANKVKIFNQSFEEKKEIEAKFAQLTENSISKINDLSESYERQMTVAENEIKRLWVILHYYETKDLK